LTSFIVERRLEAYHKVWGKDIGT